MKGEANFKAISNLCSRRNSKKKGPEEGYNELTKRKEFSVPKIFIERFTMDNLQSFVSILMCFSFETKADITQ